MKTRSANEAKASFSRIYSEATPHGYLDHLGRLDYSICDELRPFCALAAADLRARGRAVRMLDIGCSYGINGAILRHGLKFAELNRLFALNVSREPSLAAVEARAALDLAGVQCELSYGGLDTSQPAVRFALDAGILQHGIIADLEANPGALTDSDRAWLGHANLLVSTGAIGYVTDRSLDVLLGAMADQASRAIVLFTVLRAFETRPIEQVLARHGMQARVVPDLLLPQRKFSNATEQRDIIDVLAANDLGTDLEQGGRHFARLLVATDAEHLPDLLREMARIARGRPTLAHRERPRELRPQGESSAGAGSQAT